MKEQRTPRTLPEALEGLLSEFCIDLGFCLPPADNARICAAESWDADAFVAEVFRVEGLHPDEHLNWKRRMRNRFIEMFGTNLVTSESFEQKRKCEGK